MAPSPENASGIRTDLPPISSAAHPLVKLARSLHVPQGRRRHGACLVEGRRVVEAATAGIVPDLVLHTEAFARSDAPARALLRRLLAAGAPVREVTDAVMADLSGTVTPQGILAVVRLPDALAPAWPGTAARRPASADAPLAVILDAIADPGNAGTLVRVAAATGASVVAAPATTDLWAPKVVRAGAGAHFEVPIRTVARWEDLAGALAPGTTVIATDARADEMAWDVDMTGPVAVLVSNEARGLGDLARRAAHRVVRIPQGAGDSLNAAVAGAIVLYEAVRQRAHRAMTWHPSPVATGEGQGVGAVHPGG